MKLLIGCTECDRNHPLREETLREVELQDDPLYNVTCVCGHTFQAVVAPPKHELLFESAALALLDGYPREAVSGFAAALERFYEFWLHVLFIEAGVPEELSTSAWRLVANQSERQLGAFVMTYVREHRVLPTVLTEPQVAFRNKVIHKGYIATSAEAVAFGQVVLEGIVATDRELRTTRGPAVEEYLRRLTARFHQAEEAAVSTTIGRLRVGGAAISLDDTIRDLQQRRLPGGALTR